MIKKLQKYYDIKLDSVRKFRGSKIERQSDGLIIEGEDTFFLKFRFDSKRIENEARVLLALQKQGINCPRVVYANDKKPYAIVGDMHAVVYEYIELSPQVFSKSSIT